MDFCDLQGRLLSHVRNLLRGGEITERRLAQLSGISQPHIHNLLKGIRDLTPAMSDRILHGLQLGVLDLAETVELQNALDRRPRNPGGSREISVLAEKIGPATPWSLETHRFERVTVGLDALKGLRSPVGARVGLDPLMNTVIAAGSLVLVDLLDRGLPAPDPHALYVIERDGAAVIRWVRSTPSTCYLFHALNAGSPYRWERLEASASRLIMGRIHQAAVTHGHRGLSLRQPPGIERGPVPRSLAS